MANAAAKKAAAARESASGTYLPLMLVTNLFYLLLRVGYRWSSFSVRHGGAAALLSGLSYVSYRGILDSPTSNSNSNKNASGEQPLAGGAYLDLFGIVAAVQFGTVLVGDSFYWLLAALPLWAGWKLYSTLFGEGGMGKMLGNMMGFGGGGGGGADQDSGDGEGKGEESDKVAAKKQKRAERRRQKWS